MATGSSSQQSAGWYSISCKVSPVALETEVSTDSRAVAGLAVYTELCSEQHFLDRLLCALHLTRSRLRLLVRKYLATNLDLPRHLQAPSTELVLGCHTRNTVRRFLQLRANPVAKGDQRSVSRTVWKVNTVGCSLCERIWTAELRLLFRRLQFRSAPEAGSSQHDKPYPRGATLNTQFPAACAQKVQEQDSGSGLYSYKPKSRYGPVCTCRICSVRSTSTQRSSTPNLKTGISRHG
mmetsp:Transcript_3038/g.7120  ORF Transcript_3038/g.7120 Transcript_3038/m.7120 type:complete len:236 (-) Transcript_3038:596-1303(-)